MQCTSRICGDVVSRRSVDAPILADALADALATAQSLACSQSTASIFARAGETISLMMQLRIADNEVGSCADCGGVSIAISRRVGEWLQKSSTFVSLSL